MIIDLIKSIPTVSAQRKLRRMLGNGRCCAKAGSKLKGAGFRWQEIKVQNKVNTSELSIIQEFLENSGFYFHYTHNFKKCLLLISYDYCFCKAPASWANCPVCAPLRPPGIPIGQEHICSTLLSPLKPSEVPWSCSIPQCSAKLHNFWTLNNSTC